ncbi:MAG TPA: hypothetical protein VKN36_14670, partial [Eudoraea sp.]|nr:hypothetical protein [Eudoraea sp.]
MVLESIAQTPQIDGIRQELGRVEGEAYYVKSNDLAGLLLNVDAAEALELASKSILSNEIKAFPEQLARAYFIKGRAQILKGDYEASLLTLNTALDISEKEKPGVLSGRVHIAIGEV